MGTIFHKCMELLDLTQPPDSQLLVRRVLGEMDLDTYRNIGAAFEYVEQIEDYGIGGRPFSNVGLWMTGSEADDEGVARMLLEIQRDFVVVNQEADLSQVGAIILTGAPCLTEVQAMKLTAFAAHGGGLLVLGESGLDCGATHFVLDLGATYLGGAGDEEGRLALGDGFVCIGGNTLASNFPTTVGAYDRSFSGPMDVYVSLLSPDLSSLTASRR